MRNESEWPVRKISAQHPDAPLFFTRADWDVVEAATSRIIPTDHDPGAKEAGVTRFLDLFLSGTEYIYASATGDGFLQLEGKKADAWRARIEHRQKVYREGIAALMSLSMERHGREFPALDPEQQDEVLVELSGKPKPSRVRLGTEEQEGEGGPPPSNQPVNDEGMSFFEMLVFHARQGFYADPVYGGNENFIGWRVIGYDGPASLADTVDGTYNTLAYMIQNATWPYAQSPAVQAFPLRRPRP